MDGFAVNLWVYPYCDLGVESLIYTRGPGLNSPFRMN